MKNLFFRISSYLLQYLSGWAWKGWNNRVTRWIDRWGYILKQIITETDMFDTQKG